MSWRIDKLDKIAGERIVDAFLITSAISVKYLCGYFYNFEIGQSPFHLIPAALFIIPGGKASLIIADNETDQLPGLDPRLDVIQYPSYVYEKPLNFSSGFLEKILHFTGENQLGRARIGIESASMPEAVTEFLISKFPGIKFNNITQSLADLRIIKDPDEIQQIRASTHLCDVGQEAVIKYAEPGMTELELFSLVRKEMELTAAKRIPIMTDLVSGLKTAGGGGNPSSKIIEKNDLILSDLTPCLDGYWGDTCNTVIVGKPSAEQMNHFRLIKETLEKGIEQVKPGVKAREIDRFLRQRLANAGEYGHHSGHGVGLAYHEEPRIVPYNEIELKAGMVIALEPAIYTKDYGLRLEHLVLVTESGCEKISRFDHRIK